MQRGLVGTVALSVILPTIMLGSLVAGAPVDLQAKVVALAVPALVALLLSLALYKVAVRE
jgi:hypothetical protein